MNKSLSSLTESVVTRFSMVFFTKPYFRLQMFEHNRFTYIKHLSKRGKWLSLVEWLSTYSLKDLQKLVEAYINKIYKYGGCFHLWGHSWELDQYHLWNKLEKICKTISQLPEFSYIENKELVNFK